MSWDKLRLVIDAWACQLLLMGLPGCWARRERETITYLTEEEYSELLTERLKKQGKQAKKP